MREYEVVVTREAENQLREYIDYILHTFKSEQAADAVKNLSSVSRYR